MAWIANKIRGGFKCLKENGFWYTLKLFIKKIVKGILQKTNGLLRKLAKSLELGFLEVIKIKLRPKAKICGARHFVFLFGKQLYPRSKKNKNSENKQMVFYLKINSEQYFSLGCLQKWIEVAHCMNADFYIVCDKKSLKMKVLRTISFYSTDIKFIESMRKPLKKIISNITTPNWKNAGYSHLTTFYHAKKCGLKEFWNIDADDTEIRLPPDKIALIFEDARNYARKNDVSIFSLDMWVSRTKSKAWTFGVTYTQDVDKFIDIFDKSQKDWKDEYKNVDTGLNIDWYVTYLKDSGQIKAKTFYIENAHFIHFAGTGDFLNFMFACNICHWQDGKVEFPILKDVYKDYGLGVLSIPQECIKIDIGLQENISLDYKMSGFVNRYDKLFPVMGNLWHIKDSSYWSKK